MHANLSTVAGPAGNLVRYRTTKRREAQGVELPGAGNLGRLSAAELQRLEHLTQGSILIPAGTCLARYGHPFHDVYALRTGRIQASITYVNGYVRMLSEYRSGDVIGLDALLRGSYPADFIALEQTIACP